VLSKFLRDKFAPLPLARRDKENQVDKDPVPLVYRKPLIRSSLPVKKLFFAILIFNALLPLC
jgi:hypothetical protein